MDGIELDNYIQRAKDLAQSRITKAQHEFGLGNHANFDLNLERCTITFSGLSHRIKATASVIPIGSWAKGAQTWLWSWENESIPKQVSAPMGPVKLFGDQHEISALQHTFSPCDEAMAWALASISLKILDAQCVYRVDRGKNLLFLLLNELKLAK